MPESVQAACGVRVGYDIPVPVVDLATATRDAKARLHDLRAKAEVKAAKAAIVDKHGSRKGMPGRTRRTPDGHEDTRPSPSRARKANAAPGTHQLTLDI